MKLWTNFDRILVKGIGNLQQQQYCSSSIVVVVLQQQYCSSSTVVAVLQQQYCSSSIVVVVLQQHCSRKWHFPFSFLVKPQVFISVAKRQVKLGLIFVIFVHTVVVFTNFCSKTLRKSLFFLFLPFLPFFLGKTLGFRQRGEKVGQIWSNFWIFCSKTLNFCLFLPFFQKLFFSQ